MFGVIVNKTAEQKAGEEETIFLNRNNSDLLLLTVLCTFKYFKLQSIDSERAAGKGWWGKTKDPEVSVYLGFK